jgi:hypothetical protein
MPQISHLVGAALFLALAACTIAPVETERTVPGNPTAVRGRIEAELGRLGLVPEGGTGDILVASGTAVPAGWASCPPELVGQNDRDRRMVTVGTRRGTVRVSLAPAGDSTRVRVATDFSGTYRNPFTTYRFERPCRSRGEVESRLLQTAGGSTS